MKTVGDQVVGESSTMHPSNQYRGIQSVTGSGTSPVGELLPNMAGGSITPDQSAADSRVAVPVGSESFPANENRPFQRVADSPRPGEGQGSQFRKANHPNSMRSVMSDDTFANQPEAAATQMIGTKRFRLNYGIDAIDPSGVAQVDLWMTRDGGRNWETWGRDSDNASPFPVEVEEEGLYGFRIVVHSKDGLTGRGPSSGDKPDIWIQVDTQSPLAQITSVPYGRGEEAGRLVINYSVADSHLVLRPITLSYSDLPEGPWIAIEDGLRNEGRYLWKPDSHVPDRIYLRLDARDRAGNMGVHILNQPIDVSGLVPRGTIHGVVPVGN